MRKKSVYLALSADADERWSGRLLVKWLNEAGIDYGGDPRFGATYHLSRLKDHNAIVFSHLMAKMFIEGEPRREPPDEWASDLEKAGFEESEIFRERLQKGFKDSAEGVPFAIYLPLSESNLALKKAEMQEKGYPVFTAENKDPFIEWARKATGVDKPISVSDM